MAYDPVVLRDPGGRAPAPYPLRSVQLFVNTLDIENGVEELTGPAALREALARAGVLEPDGAPLADADVRAALEVREALRELALANNGGALGADAAATLARAARAAGLTLGFGGGPATRLEPTAGGVDGALGRLLAIVHDARVDGSWRRLKACRRDVCHWLYWDRSRNGASTWCAMSVCGNRTNTRRYRARRAGRPVS